LKSKNDQDEQSRRRARRNESSSKETLRIRKMQYSLEHFKVERVGFEPTTSAYFLIELFINYQRDG
jgi:hypothetical protein